MMNKEINVGDEICFFEGKGDKPVAYGTYGKVVLCKHKVPLGYARVLTVEEKENFIW